jgi:hypothetical protein
LPAAECDDDITPEDVFARGVVTDLAPYFTDNEWKNRVATISDCIERLEANTSYKLFIAAHDKENNKYEYCIKEFATQKHGTEKGHEVVLSDIDIETLSSDKVTLGLIVNYADFLYYHICEGDSCNCILSDNESGMTDIAFDSNMSFVHSIYPTFEIEGLKPNTTYHITVKAANRISTAQKELTFTTAQ